MSSTRPLSAKWALVCGVALGVATTFGTPARAAFHLWTIQELYSNSSGTLQFIELTTSSPGQEFVNGLNFQVANIGNTLFNNYTMPNNLPTLPPPGTQGHTFLMGTAGIQAAGGPAPDFIIPNNFLFTAGGTINWFATPPSAAYASIPTDGTSSRIWNGGINPVNSPQNFAGQTGVVTVPEPTTLILAPMALGGLYLSRRRKVRPNVDHS